MTPRPLWPAILIGWALTAALLVAMSAQAIGAWRFPDPDDAMRLMQVRDLLAGQSWWDVGQYRLAGGAMHWSRLVDLPLAGVMLIARPVLGQSGAETAALVIVPLMTMLAVFALIALLTRRLAGDAPARLAVLIAPLSVPLLYQLRPLRIDHHGWQVVLALAALCLLVGKSTARAGVLLGASLAALIAISLEGLPIAAALTGIVALGWAFDSTRRPMLLGAVWGLFLSALLLQLATRGIHYAAPMCDALTPDWLLVLGVGAVGVTAASLVPGTSWVLRLAALGIVGVLAVAVLLQTAPECVGGPFAQLDPLTRRLWYANTDEGLPLWRQSSLGWAAMTIGLPVTGLVGTLLALRQSEGAARMRWLLAGAALVAGVALAVLVQRAGATANAFAVPGAAWALDRMLQRARRIENVGTRTLATAAALLAVCPGLVVLAVVGFPRTEARRGATPEVARAACERGTDARVIGAALPPSRIFAPLDLTPDLLVASAHRGIASGHHRNHTAMHDVLAAFTGTPEAAHALIRRYRADYVVVCPGLNEPELYRRENPHGFWARLEDGERFDWLEHVAIPDSAVRVWRVR
ncbi:hypothetical protein ACG3SL_00010 [Sphingomonas sp. CJ20]